MPFCSKTFSPAQCMLCLITYEIKYCYNNCIQFIVTVQSISSKAQFPEKSQHPIHILNI